MIMKIDERVINLDFLITVRTCELLAPRLRKGKVRAKIYGNYYNKTSTLTYTEARI